MLATHKTHTKTRLQGILFVTLFLTLAGMLAWLSTRYSVTADWTAGARNTLSPASTALLDRLQGPVRVTAYATEDESVRRSVNDMIERYRRNKKDIQLEFVNPDLEPETVRQLGISMNGEMMLEYQGRSDKLQDLSEQGITNALQRLARGAERWLVFLDGHGERKPFGAANHDLGQWAQQLEAKGFKARSLNLAETQQIPENTAALVVAGPQVNLLPGEVDIVKSYVAAGGNLLWLGDPGELHGLQPLADALGVSFLPGMIVDPATRVLGIGDPRFALVVDYAPHAVTRRFDNVTLFPQAAGLKAAAPEGWETDAILRTGERSWVETGKLDGTIQYDAGEDQPGPLDVGFALTRTVGEEAAKEQRVVVIGDGDFLSNAYLGNGGNLELGVNLITWLAHDDQFMDIPVKTAQDRTLQLSTLAQGVIGLGFLFVLPLLMAAGGVGIWWRRRKL
jgi:ABC-type uncharacterized transport system involved in gliding motility auxiliary subunit